MLLFQSFAPLNEKDFLPFSVPIFGNLGSVDILRSLYEVLCEFFLNKLRKERTSYTVMSDNAFNKRCVAE